MDHTYLSELILLAVTPLFIYKKYEKRLSLAGELRLILVPVPFFASLFFQFILEKDISKALAVFIIATLGGIIGYLRICSEEEPSRVGLRKDILQMFILGSTWFAITSLLSNLPHR